MFFSWISSLHPFEDKTDRKGRGGGVGGLGG